MAIHSREARRFERTGLLALDPKALLEMFVVPEAPPTNAEVGGAVVIEVRGPLTQRDDYWCDSYEGLGKRVASACESGCPAIVLRIDSPGGEAQGCFEIAREIRSMVAAAGKQLYAFVDGSACSAAYALASAAQWITLSETATVGSIGVLSSRIDYTQQNAANGIRVAFVTSGARKADGHPDHPISEAELAAEQTIVDSLAAVFFQMVADFRQLDIAAVEQLDARVLHGAGAVAVGLGDEVATFGSLLARVAAGGMERVIMDYAKMRAAVEEVAKGDDANAKAAQAALAALQAAEGSGGEEPDDAEEKPEGDPPPTTEDEKPKPTTADPKPEEDKPAASKAGGDLAAQAWAKVHELEAKLAARDERDERAKLFASRPDFGPELLKVLKTAPIETVRDMVASLPKGPARAATAKLAAAAQSDVKPTTGAGQGEGTAAQSSPEVKARLDRQMGLGDQGPTVVNEPYRMTLSGVPKKAPAAPVKGN